MRKRARLAMLRAMSSTEPVDLHCRITHLAESIVGQVSDGRGRAVPFNGWIEFSAALTSFVEDAQGTEPNPPKEQPDE